MTLAVTAVTSVVSSVMSMTQVTAQKRQQVGGWIFLKGWGMEREGVKVALLLIYHCTVMTTDLCILGIYNVTAVGLSWPATISP